MSDRSSLVDAMIAAAEAISPVRLVCRHCGMSVSLSFIRALLNDRVHGVAQCFCGGIEWDYA